MPGGTCPPYPWTDLRAVVVELFDAVATPAQKGDLVGVNRALDAYRTGVEQLRTDIALGDTKP